MVAQDPFGTAARAARPRRSVMHCPLASLCRFLDDGIMEIDNNAAERAIRPIAKMCSLCTPLSSTWKHSMLVLEIVRHAASLRLSAA